ncbi:MAG: C40 family peptidase [Eubacterium sp.]|nr:C40 family peptidase [Eubacterium sp.]
MRYKTLSLLILCCVLLAGLFILDNYVLSGGQDQDTERKRQEPEAVSLNLVVGQAGSIKKDVGAPIFADKDLKAEKTGSIQYNCCVIKEDPENGVNESEWIPVEAGDNTQSAVGYVQPDDIKEYDLVISDQSRIRMEIVKNALHYLGLRFKRYGGSLKNGIDCSNFVQQIYKLSGISIPSKCNDIIKSGDPVALKRARPGDIVYYPVNNGYGHVGIYLNDGFIISSSGHSGKTYPEGGVRISYVIYRDREEYTVYDLIDS